MKLSRSLAARRRCAALALPAAASAHPGVYTSHADAYRAARQRRRCHDAAGQRPPACRRQRTQYAVGQRRVRDGFTEGRQRRRRRGPTARRGRGWSTTASCRAPGAARPTATDRKRWMRTRPRRPTCRRTRPASAPRGTRRRTSSRWQDDPFYNYIPWQRTSVGIGDEPAKWIASSRSPPASTCAALNTRGEAEAACTGTGRRLPRRPTRRAAITGELEIADATRRCRARSRSCRPASPRSPTAKTAVDAQLAAALAAEARAASR